MGKAELLTKEQVHAAIFASREWYNFSSTPLWSRAFQLYNETVPKDQQLRMSGCGKCFQTVRAWLER